MRKEDVVGISSLSFSNTGNGIYLSSSSELQQISLSARHTVAAGGGRVEVERREEEEGGEGDTDSQADRWVFYTQALLDLVNGQIFHWQLQYD